jgi:hypothetical protein
LFWLVGLAGWFGFLIFWFFGFLVFLKSLCCIVKKSCMFLKVIFAYMEDFQECGSQVTVKMAFYHLAGRAGLPQTLAAPL